MEDLFVKLTNHAVDTVELGSKQVGVGRLIFGGRGAGKRLNRRHLAGHSPGLVQNTFLDGRGRVGAIPCRGNATIYSCQCTGMYDARFVLTR